MKPKHKKGKKGEMDLKNKENQKNTSAILAKDHAHKRRDK
jgi:hypothetical protein